jgi:hypothetical protein
LPSSAEATTSRVAVDGELQVRVTDRNGDAPSEEMSDYVLVLGIDDESDHTTVLVDGRASVPVPAGRYSVAAFVGTPEADGTISRTLAVDPLVEVAAKPSTGSGPRSIPVALDARTARRPVTVEVADRPAAERTGGLVLFSQPGARGGSTHPWYAYDIDTSAGNYVTPTEQLAGSHLYVYSELSKDGVVESPYTYHLISDAPGRVPARPGFSHRTSRLAVLRSTMAAQGDPECGVLRAGTLLPGENVGFGGSGATVTTPAEHVDYFTPGPQDWSLRGHYAGPDCDGSGSTDSFGVRRSFPSVGEQTQAWGRAPLGPALSDTDPLGDEDRPYFAYARREGDRLVLDVPMVADSGVGHYSVGARSWPFSGYTGSTTLSVDGTVVGSSDRPGAGEFEVGPDPATYVVDTDVARDYPWSGSSVAQNVRWTFQSAHDPDDVPDALPFHVVRFDAALDDHGRGPAGPFQLGLRVENWPSAPVGTIEDVTLDVSYDDGATWQSASVSPTPGTDGWTASLDHPAGASWVSLRAHAADDDGNAVDQTIVHAYELEG